MSIVPVIIAGGLGSRLWPLSSKEKPKPFIKLFGEHSLFQKTLLRVLPFLEGRLPLVVTNKDFHDLCNEQAEQVGIESYYSLLEPCLRNTAPAIISAAQFLSENENDPIMLVLPADHVITPFDTFAKCINEAIAFAEQGKVVTFGIEPTEPKTCYGYIKQGKVVGESGFAIDSFKEKPAAPVASEYVNSKQYLWNSGIFMAKASVFLKEMEKVDSEDLALIKQAVNAGDTKGTHTFLNETYYGQLKSDSIDYAIMEKTEQGVVVPAKLDWSDIGTWNAYWDHHDKDEHDNLLEGNVSSHDSKGCLLISQGVEIIGFGLEDIVAVSNGDKVMITTRAKAPELKKILKERSQKVLTS